MLVGLPPSKRLVHLEGQNEVEQPQNMLSLCFSPAVVRPHRKAFLEIFGRNKGEYFLYTLLSDHDYFQAIQSITKVMITPTNLHGI